MLRHLFTTSLCLALVFQAAQATEIPAYITTAVSDSSRPKADTARDALRKPGDVIAFSGLKPGDRIADLNPGSGYYTRIFSGVVGNEGRVYGLVPQVTLERRPEAGDPIKAIAEENSNVTFQSVDLYAVRTPELLDMVWTSNNYHDFKNAGNGVTTAMNASIYDVLKPGGIYMVTDHVAEPGSRGRDTNTLHRIDPVLIKQEVEAAGFILEGESDILHNPDDDHTRRIFNIEIRGRTDRIVLRFRKPS